MKKLAFIVFVFGVFGLPHTLLAQTEPEDIALAQNEFQDAFYESLKQKGIENYDKAIGFIGEMPKIGTQQCGRFFRTRKKLPGSKGLQKGV